MSTEKLATSTITRVIAQCPHLDPVLNDNDTVAFTDGHIDRYSARPHTKKTHLGTTQVQVKGRFRPKGRKAPSAYSLYREDLNGYLNKRGVLFFLVSIETETNDEQILFSVLSPLKIDRLLQSAPQEDKKISFPLDPLPTESTKIEGIVKYMEQTQDEDPKNTISWEALSVAAEGAVNLPGGLDLDKPTHLKPGEDDFSIELTTAEGFRGFALMELTILPSSYLLHQSGVTVSSGDIVYENPMWRRTGTATLVIQLSESLRLHVADPEHGEDRGHVELKMSDSLDERLRDLGFFFSWIDGSGILINGNFHSWSLGPSSEDEDLRQHYKQLQRFAEVLEFVGARLDLIDLSDVTSQRFDQVLSLYQPLIDGVEVAPTDPTEPHRLRLPIGQWHIELLLFEGSKPGSFRVQHLLDPSVERKFIGEEDNSDGVKYHPVTPYELLEPTMTGSTLNLALNRVVGIYSRISEYKTTQSQATITVLRFLNAADETPVRRNELIDAADNLNQWIIDEYGDEDPSFVNRLQIKIRRGHDLSDDEKTELRHRRAAARRDQGPLSEFFILSSTILLGEREEADYLLEQLPLEDQDTFQSWPIWTVHTQGWALPHRSDEGT